MINKNDWHSNRIFASAYKDVHQSVVQVLLETADLHVVWDFLMGNQISIIQQQDFSSEQCKQGQFKKKSSFVLNKRGTWWGRIDV